MTAADYPDFATPQAHATAIAATGVPLLSSPAILATSIAQVVAASGTETFANEVLTQTGYAIELVIAYPAAATNPFCEVRLTWTDPVSGIVYGEQHYFVVGGTAAAPMTTLGSGPARSAQLTVAVTNLDTVQAATVTMLLAQDSTIRQADRWGWRNAANASGIVPANTLATLPDDESVPGYLNAVNVLNAANATWLFGMAPGQLVQLSGSASSAAALAYSYQVRGVPSSVYTASGYLLYSDVTTTGFNGTFIAPRAPVSLKITNNGTASAAFHVQMTAQG